MPSLLSHGLCCTLLSSDAIEQNKDLLELKGSSFGSKTSCKLLAPEDTLYEAPLIQHGHDQQGGLFGWV